MIKQNSVVTMHYELKNAQGEILDSSKVQNTCQDECRDECQEDKHEPLAYLHGASNIIVGLEEQLLGKAVGDEVNAVVSPEKGYGQPVDALIQVVPKEAFGAEVDNVEVGMRFQAETEQGPVPVVVTAMDDQNVTVDGNHPLAGQELHFNVTIVDVRDASAQEIEQGQVEQSPAH